MLQITYKKRIGTNYTNIEDQKRAAEEISIDSETILQYNFEEFEGATYSSLCIDDEEITL